MTEQSPILVSLNDHDLLMADAWQKSIGGTGLFQTENYTGLCEPGRFATGYKGELILAHLFGQRDIWFKYQVDTRGKRNPHSEFVVKYDGKAYSLEVKTASKLTHQYFCFPEVQRRWQRSSLYAGVRLRDDRSGEVMGWLKGSEVRALPVGRLPGREIQTVHCPWDKMRDIETLLERLDRS